MMESTQVLECTQVLDSQSCFVDERIDTPVKVATLTIDGIDYCIWNRENTIGRDAKCSIVLNSKAVSVEHAVIEADLQGGHFICDLGSTNKTKLGDVQLKPRVKYFIKDGDSLKIANLKGVYRHVQIDSDPIPPKSSTPPTAEPTTIPESPERKEDDAVESIIAETPRKDGGSGADSSDGDIFGETSDSSALFVRPLKFHSIDQDGSGVDSGVPMKSGGSDAERVGSLEDSKKDGASQSVAGDHLDVLQGNEVVDESYATDADSSDLVAGSQPMFTPDKRDYDPKVLESDTLPPDESNFEDELTVPPKDYQWENIDDTVDEISTHMDTIDSLVDSKELNVTYTPPKRKPDNPGLDEVDIPNQSIDLIALQPSETGGEVAHLSSSSPNMKKFNKNKIVKHLEEDLDEPLIDSSLPGDDDKPVPGDGDKPVLGDGDKPIPGDGDKPIPGDGDKPIPGDGDKPIPGDGDKPANVYELETQDMTGEESNAVTANNIEMVESNIDESSDIVVGSQPIAKDDIFNYDTVPMGVSVNEQNLHKLNIFDLATQQVQTESGMQGHASGNNSNIHDLETQPFPMPDVKINSTTANATANGRKTDLLVEDIDQGAADISISDFPTQAVSGFAETASGKVQVENRKFATENAPLQHCDVSISDMATQAASVVTNSELNAIHDSSISDMPTQAVRINQNREDHNIKENESCDISLSDIATQLSVPRNKEEVVSAPNDVSSSVQSKEKTYRSKWDTTQQNLEDIYNVMTQMPAERSHIVVEEANHKISLPLSENSDVRALHDVSVSDMLTQPCRVQSDESNSVHRVADISLSDLPTQAAVAKHDVSKNVTSRLEDEETQDIFNAMTQLPVSNDKILLEASDTQLLNSEVNKCSLDVSLSDMMTQPAKSDLVIPRKIPSADISISDLPTQVTTAEKSDAVLNQDSEDIYNVMTQLPVENEKILLDVSDTQQINNDLENCELLESALKTSNSTKGEESLERLKNDAFQFKVPTPVKGLDKFDRVGNADVYTMETQPMDTPVRPNPSNDDIVDHKPVSAKSETTEVSACADDSISTLATQDAKNDPTIDSEVSKDVFEVETEQIPDRSELTNHASHDAPGSNSATKNEVVLEKFDKETDSKCEQEPVVPSTQEIDPNSVEDRIRAMSDKNVNSFATQQILTSSNTKSTVAELLETLEDTSSQVVRSHRKVKKLDYTDSEDSNSPVIRSTRKAKTLDEFEEDYDSPLIAPRKKCLPLNDSQDEVQNIANKMDKISNAPANGSDNLYNGDKHKNKSELKDSPNVTSSPIVDELPKSTKSEVSRTLDNNEAVKVRATEGKKTDAVEINTDQVAVVEDAESSVPDSKAKDKLTHVEENNTGGSDSLQLHLSTDVSQNKSNATSAPTTPEKRTDLVLDVTPTTRDLVELPERKSSPETPEIPKDFFGTPMFRDKPILRQYVNKKKLSLSNSSLLKGPNASSTPKSDLDSYDVLEMEETLMSGKASAVKTRKVIDVKQKAVDSDYSTPKNVKKFKKASPQKRKSAELFDNSSQDDDLLNSQESLDSQGFGRGKRRKQKKSFFGFDDKEDVEFSAATPSKKGAESVQDAHHSEKPRTSPLKTAAHASHTDKIQVNSTDKAISKKTPNDETVKLEGESKRVKLSSEVGTKRISDKESTDMELTCVRSTRLLEDEEAVVNVKKFRRASPKKPEPVGVEVISKNDVESASSSQPSNKTQQRKRNVSSSESESGKDILGPTRRKIESSNPGSTSSGVSSTSPAKSLRGRKASSTKQNSDSETEPRPKSKRSRVENTPTNSQEMSEPEEGTKNPDSQEISIKNMANRLKGAMKSNMKLEEENIQVLNRRGRLRKNSGGRHTNVKEEDVKKGSIEGNISGTPFEISLKKEVKTRKGPQKAVNQNEKTLEKTEENIPNIEPNKSSARAPLRRGRGKLSKAEEDSVTNQTETQAASTSLEVSIPKRGRRAKNAAASSSKEAAEGDEETTGLNDSQNAPSVSGNVSKTKRRGKTTVEDSSAFETDQDSQSQELSQGRRSGRARKKKESFDDIMYRKEEEIRQLKLQRHSTLSQSSDKSRSTSRASVASSSKTEEDGSTISAPKRRGRPKKQESLAPTSTVQSVDDDTVFSVPPSPAGSNSSRRKPPRPGSASSSHSEAETTLKQNEQTKNSVSSSVVKVMFTGLADAKLSSMVKKLGGKVVEKPSDCTVLVTDKVRRTVKFLCALSLGKPIVSPNWLSKSKSFNKFTDTYDSLLKDGEAEDKFDFKLKESLEKAQSSRLLEGFSFYATPSVLPPPAEIKPIVECAGGTYLAKPPAKWASNAAIISSPKDKSDWTKLTKHGVLPPILSAEALLSGVLQQKFDFGKHRLK
ncbi:hypothetical protein GE061_002102 [Apolygus lucorum]|uniref:Mediator of DNA damage checkpoint protein 1 n=1 Tax=Apolygus lucorum TaxID=248454 RepID=A0A6A4JCL7_APOLU|nr:hypothetical protein GE061_002102 [Apolygus lucorum]